LRKGLAEKYADFTATLKASVLQGEGEDCAFELSLRAISRAGSKLNKMADHKELPVYKAGYDLVLEVFVWARTGLRA
jgi:hypothetical protein